MIIWLYIYIPPLFKDVNYIEFPSFVKYLSYNKLMKSERTKALMIDKKTKLEVWERDNHCCIFCGAYCDWNLANSHFIKRSHGGLGIPENIMTNCLECHHLFDDTPMRKYMIQRAEDYLRSKYPDWNIDNLRYKKN